MYIYIYVRINPKIGNTVILASSPTKDSYLGLHFPLKIL